MASNRLISITRLATPLFLALKSTFCLLVFFDPALSYAHGTADESSAECLRHLTTGRTFHQDFVIESVKANQKFPQFNAGIRVSLLAFFLKNQPTSVAELFSDVTEEDVKIVAEAMDRVHSAMKIEVRSEYFDKSGHEGDSVSASARIVEKSRLQDLAWSGFRATAANFLKTMQLFNPSRHFANVPESDYQLERFPDHQRARLIEFQMQSSDNIELYRKMGKAFEAALLAQNVSYAAKMFRLSLKPNPPPGPRWLAVHVINSLEKALLDHLTEQLPQLDRDEWRIWLSSTTLLTD